MQNNINFYLNILGLLSLIGASILVLKSKVKTDNLNDLKERVEILEKELQFTKAEKEKERRAFRQELESEISTRRELHLENQKSIANLQGQLATYKEIPLKSIADSLQKITISNDAIMNTLIGDAKIAATDRDTLLNPNQNVENQNVEHQTVKSKKEK